MTDATSEPLEQWLAGTLDTGRAHAPQARASNMAAVARRSRREHDRTVAWRRGVSNLGCRWSVNVANSGGRGWQVLPAGQSVGRDKSTPRNRHPSSVSPFFG